MSDTVPTPVPGNPASKGAPDGVSGAPGSTDGPGVHGRSPQGESGGAAYPNPHTGNGDPKSEFFSDTGQTPNDYFGSGQAGDEGGSAPNGVAGSNEDRDTADRPVPVPAPVRSERQATAPGTTFAVVETSGIAEAETQGKIGTDAPYEEEQKQPGSG
ncbi:hypothetical protein [Sphingomonas montana]|uniref:hypothetical protein n=1 Tax=Sphingomonas montana TaxID=1843236 RepID=UPI00096C94CE|nr:hypothetical protein [Sphingomonas montana]